MNKLVKPAIQQSVYVHFDFKRGTVDGILFTYVPRSVYGEHLMAITLKPKNGGIEKNGVRETASMKFGTNIKLKIER